MDLEEYLEAVKVCPDEELEPELGLYDNFILLLRKGGLEALKVYFEGSDKFSQERTSRGFHYRRIGTKVKVTASSGVSKSATTGRGVVLDKQVEEHIERQLKEYDSTMIIQTCTDSPIEDQARCSRQIANTFLLIGEAILGGRLGVCLPYSAGSNHTGDYSRVIYYEP